MANRKLLITGAGSGIGRAVAEWADTTGEFELVLIDRDAHAIETLNEELNSPSKALRADVTDESFWTSDALAADLTGLTEVALCAGVSDAGEITGFEYETWKRILDINLSGMFLALKASFAAMGEGGSVVMVSSATARKAARGTAAYGASKAGLEQLMRVASLEVAARGITVNAVAPGGVKTPMFSSQDWFKAMVAEKGSEEAVWTDVAAQTPTGKFSEPGEIAQVIAFLFGPAARNITGAVLACDGGYSAE